MADLLSGGVMRGMVAASSSMKTAQTAMSVYNIAKAKNDEGTMQRALGYAADSMSEAMDASEESKVALAENIKAAREEEKAEQNARLEKELQESAEKKVETQESNNEANKTPIDIIEISPEAISALQNEQPIVVAQSEDIPKHIPSTQTTPDGGGNAKTIKHRKINVSV